MTKHQYLLFRFFLVENPSLMQGHLLAPHVTWLWGYFFFKSIYMQSSDTIQAERNVNLISFLFGPKREWFFFCLKCPLPNYMLEKPPASYNEVFSVWAKSVKKGLTYVNSRNAFSSMFIITTLSVGVFFSFAAVNILSKFSAFQLASDASADVLGFTSTSAVPFSEFKVLLYMYTRHIIRTIILQNPGIKS